jgi:hypothetical protein
MKARMGVVECLYALFACRRELAAAPQLCNTGNDSNDKNWGPSCRDAKLADAADLKFQPAE